MKTVVDHAILWRRLDRPGHDFACLTSWDDGWKIEGSAVFCEEGRPCRLDYTVVCDSNWRTRSGRVEGLLGTNEVAIEIVADNSHRWRLNGIEREDLKGCIDLDLAFTPATNLIPVRRLALAVGERSTVRSAWLTFPALGMTTLEQTYRRVGFGTYAYEAPSLDFAAELRVNERGTIVDYPHLWIAEAFA